MGNTGPMKSIFSIKFIHSPEIKKFGQDILDDDSPQ